MPDGIVHVAIVEENRHTQVAAKLSDGTYRGIFPVELCDHNHETIPEAISCGAPRALAFAAIIHSIGKSMLETLAEETSDESSSE